MPGTYPGYHRVHKPLLGRGIDRTHPSTAGLVECWTLNEGGGPPSDPLRRQAATFSASAPTWGLVGDGRHVGPKLGFVAASSQVVTLGPARKWGSPDPNQLTYEFLARVNAASNRQTIFSNDLTTAGCPTLEIGSLSISMSVPGVFTMTTVSGSIVANTWYHAIVTRNGAGSHEVDVNGVTTTLAINNTTQAYLDTLTVKNIGARQGTNNFYDGDLGWFRAWSRYMPPGERLAIFDDPWAMARPGGARRFFALSGAAGSVGTASGASTASGVGAALDASTASASGSATASGVGASLDASTGTASGTSGASGAGASTAGAVGSSAGTSTAAGVGASDSAARPYSDTFESDAAGALPGWSGSASPSGTAGSFAVSASAPIRGLRSFVQASALDSMVMYYAGPAGSPYAPYGDGDLAFLQRVKAGAGSSTMTVAPMVGIDATGVDGYAAVIVPGSTDAVNLYRAPGYTILQGATLSAGLGRPAVDGDLIWSRLRRSGTTISARFWLDGSAEPSAWLVSTADATYGAGYFGLRPSGALAGQALAVDDLAVGNLTLAAPTPYAPAAGITSTSIALLWPPATGGTAGYGYQVKISLHGAGIFSNFGAPSGLLAATVTGLAASTAYDFEILVTDAASGASTSAILTASTASGAGSTGTASGTSTAPGVGASVAASVGTAAGTSTASGVSPPAVVPFDDLVDAVVARVQAALVAPGTLAWFGTGAAPDVLPSGLELSLPYACLAEPDEDDDYWNTSGDSTAEGHLEISCYAGSKKAARLAGDRVAALFAADALASAPLVFNAGLLYYFRQSGRTAGLDPDPAPGGVGDCWSEVRQFHFMYSF